MAGVDQQRKAFCKTVHRRFLEKAPESNIGTEGRYGLESADSVRKHVKNLSADVHKFAKTLRSVRACEPVGATENQVMRMAVAVHEGKGETMFYEYKNYGPSNWIGFKAWLIWRNHSKWMSPTAYASGDDIDALDGSTPNHGLVDSVETVRGSVLNSSATNNWAVKQNKVCGSPTIRKPEERFGLETKNAKLLRQEEQRTQAVKSMAESPKRKLDALKERNAVVTFSPSEAAHLPETLQVFAALRKAHLSHALKPAPAVLSEIAAAQRIANSESGFAEVSTLQVKSIVVEPSSAHTSTFR